LPFHQKRIPNEHQSVTRAAFVIMGEINLLQSAMLFMISDLQDLPNLFTPRRDEFAKPVAPEILVDSDGDE